MSRSKFFLATAALMLITAAQYYAMKTISPKGIVLIVLFVTIALTGTAALATLISSLTKNPSKTLRWFGRQFVKEVLRFDA